MVMVIAPERPLKRRPPSMGVRKLRSIPAMLMPRTSGMVESGAAT
ncbi:MAG: hypothetical protein M5U28_24705 [Sandaracinaceae bacterium]|nr:hypothetical protein [Sandaracinaceae bacterium]